MIASTGVQRNTARPFWDEQFCWQGVSESEVLLLKLVRQGVMWNNEVRWVCMAALFTSLALSVCMWSSRTVGLYCEG
jgi:hypothetical protein